MYAGVAKVTPVKKPIPFNVSNHSIVEFPPTPLATYATSPNLAKHKPTQLNPTQPVQPNPAQPNQNQPNRPSNDTSKMS